MPGHHLVTRSICKHLIKGKMEIRNPAELERHKLFVFQPRVCVFFLLAGNQS
jgi:hypothetical protein